MLYSFLKHLTRIPNDLHRDSTYISNEPLDSVFIDYFLTDPGNLDVIYPRMDENRVINSRLQLEDDYTNSKKLEFIGSNDMVVLLRNDRYESGAFYLTKWTKEGDSLRFEKLYPQPFLFTNTRFDHDHKQT